MVMNKHHESYFAGLFNSGNTYSIFIILFLCLSALVSGQEQKELTAAKNIIFTQSLAYLVKDYSLGYEIKTNTKTSYTIITDVYKPLFNEYLVPGWNYELQIYKGFSIRPGIKFMNESGLYNAFESIYKFSGYDKKKILKEDKDGDLEDVYNLESRTCHSVGFAYKFGYELNKHHIFFSPYIMIGARVRFDKLTIYGKYDFRNVSLSDETVHVNKIWPLPMFRLGFLFGFGI
jgi:hypothetical protein